MACTGEYRTAQEKFWAGEFGDSYTGRNEGAGWIAANTALFSRILSLTAGIQSVVEFGANVGLNLRAIDRLLPDVDMAAVEINAAAARELRAWGRCTVAEGSIFNYVPSPSDLAFTKGVLIHINPDELPRVYDKLAEAGRRYVLMAEYYNPTPTTVPYRGHEERLFKRDFAGDFLDRHPAYSVLDYGFAWRRDPNFPQDDLTWFLLERRNAVDP